MGSLATAPERVPLDAISCTWASAGVGTLLGSLANGWKEDGWAAATGTGAALGSLEHSLLPAPHRAR
jgi:hypothetical protein